MSLVVLLLTCWQFTTPAGDVQDALGFRPLLTFPATDTVSRYEATLGSQLVVHVVRMADVHDRHMGWFVAVYRRPVSKNSRNLLYHSLSWHGPYPTDLLAWIHRERYYPDDRILPVHGYAYDVRLVCQDCAVAGDSTAPYFTRGTIHVSSRRLKRAHPAVPNIPNEAAVKRT
jgi:hypothetical protein